jgi:hypothetical protein
MSKYKQRNNRISIRFKPEQLAQLRELAAKQKIPIAQVVKRQLSWGSNEDQPAA